MRQISAAANPVAAIDVCAAAPTRNEDGSPGSAPVSVTRSRAAGSPPAADHRSARICAGEALSVGLMLMRDEDSTRHRRRVIPGMPALGVRADSRAPGGSRLNRRR